MSFLGDFGVEKVGLELQKIPLEEASCIWLSECNPKPASSKEVHCYNDCRSGMTGIILTAGLSHSSMLPHLMSWAPCSVGACSSPCLMPVRSIMLRPRCCVHMLLSWSSSLVPMPRVSTSLTCDPNKLGEGPKIGSQASFAPPKPCFAPVQPQPLLVPLQEVICWHVLAARWIGNNTYAGRSGVMNRTCTLLCKVCYWSAIRSESGNVGALKMRQGMQSCFQHVATVVSKSITPETYLFELIRRRVVYCAVILYPE